MPRKVVTKKDCKRLVVVCRSGKAPTAELVDDGLAALQKIVGEPATVSSPIHGSRTRFGFVYNDEALFQHLAPNLIVLREGAFCYLLHGNVVIDKCLEDTSISMTERDARKFCSFAAGQREINGFSVVHVADGESLFELVRRGVVPRDYGVDAARASAMGREAFVASAVEKIRRTHHG